MKRCSRCLFLFFIFVYFCLTLEVYASSKYVVLFDVLNIRKGPGTSYGKIKTANIGARFNLKSDILVTDEGGCQGGWYEIDYSGASAYVCSEYVKVYEEGEIITDDVEPTTACEKELKDKGFTSTYFIPLCKLKETYPNWNFEPINTGLDFTVVVDQESKCGKSYIETRDPNYMDATCKSDYSATSIWKPASLGAVRYYLDPRNFFDEKRIFMFETLSYVETLNPIYNTAVNSVLQNAAFYKYHINLGKDFSNIINTAGRSINVSPTFIASRMYQEMGASTSLYNLYSGVYPSYEGYYNFYNYGVSDSCVRVNGTTKCGLEYAKANNWYGLEAGIKGGMQSIGKTYISVGQNTRYLQKYNVAPSDPDKIYTHQYMTNIRAPYGEASIAYNSYKNSNSLNTNFTFSIPVYTNMPAVTKLPTSSDDNTNNGAVDGGSPSSPEEGSNLAPKAIIKSSGYSYIDNYITKIELNTPVETLKSSLESIGGSNTVTIKNDKGSVVTSGYIGTGYSITIKGNITEEFKVLIYGDINGDGDIGPLDLLKVQRHILKTATLSDVYFKGADVSHDGNINPLDLLKVQRHILKIENIKQ